MSEPPITDQDLSVFRHRLITLGGSLSGEEQRRLLRATETYRYRERERDRTSRAFTLPRKTLSQRGPVLERLLERDDMGEPFRIVLRTILRTVEDANTAIAQMVSVFAESDDAERRERAVRTVHGLRGGSQERGTR